jgi:hypothetical protein
MIASGTTRGRRDVCDAVVIGDKSGPLITRATDSRRSALGFDWFKETTIQCHRPAWTSWRGFHHHATLGIDAYGFLVSERET